MSWQRFQGVKVPAPEPKLIKRRYSVTADIVSFQLCPRQYGHFAVRGYVPANAVQAFFGTVIHQVLDRAHAHFKGMLDPFTKGKLPTDQDIDRYFDDVQRALKARGVRAFIDESNLARELVKRFNRLEGPTLYPCVKDTEHRIQNDQGQYILHGVVDVLVNPALKNPKPDQMEIWDYKASKFPGADLQKRQRFEFQMLVYAELYRARNGVYPAKAILYFMNELAGPPPTSRPANALYEVRLDKQRIKQALDEFATTVQQIELCHLSDQWKAPPAKKTPGKETCDICDIRWSCPSVKYDMRYP
jgi:putative RecB family exonuclease